MARKGKGGAGSVIGILAIGALALIASVPPAVWAWMGVAVVAYVVYRYSKKARPGEVPRAATRTPPSRSTAKAPNIPRDQSPVSVTQQHARAQALRLADEPAVFEPTATRPLTSTEVVKAARESRTNFPRNQQPASEAEAQPQVPGGSLRFVDTKELVSVTPAATSCEREFRIPSAPKSTPTTRWISPGQSVEVAGHLLPGGMLYVGSNLKGSFDKTDPCLIDPSLPLAKNGDYGTRDMGYWPSYSEISATARRAYLQWLAGGRKDPRADVGYVFLFFYGLERRAVLDAANDPAARADWPAIAQELRRLLDVYGGKSGSFTRYASELLNWVSLAEYSPNLYELDVPSFPQTYELPLYIRLALGQAALASAPVPAKLALAWVRLDPSISLRTPATRCAAQFGELFVQQYAKEFGQGMTLPKNRTRLKLVYRPASSGFHGRGEPMLNFGDTPDVSALTGPQKKLQALVEVVTKELEPFSRHLGKNPGSEVALESILLLPRSIWPPSAQTALNNLKARVGAGMLVLTFQDLLQSLGAQATLTKDKLKALVLALEAQAMGVEPDILGGAKPPKADERLVLFAVPSGEQATRSTPAYQAALLTLQLASAVASADGSFSIKEMSHLREQVQSWTHLTPNHVRRLLAHLRLLMDAPVTLTSLKKKLEPLDTDAKETIATFMATVAQSDGTVTPVEVKMLEKVYKALGVEPKKVFSDVHAVASGGKPGEMVKGTSSGFQLDPARIAALQQDTAKVSALLANIFKEDEVVAPAPAIEPDEPMEVDAATAMLGLDEAHSSLARMLLSRPHWSREELQDVASDLDLMLDGALERINEAAFDTHDIPFTEGDDPVDINTEILEKLEA